jgi:transcriptional regulator GlxA family with amidase domain
VPEPGADRLPHASIALNPAHQLVASQCSGALVLARLGLLESMPACADLVTQPYLAACGIQVLDGPFHAEGNIATAGGCLASVYLGAWVIDRTLGADAARAAVDYVAPVGEKAETVDRVMSALRAGDRRPSQPR